jgi:hypothetical protein
MSLMPFQLLALLALLFCAALLALRWRNTQRRAFALDRSPAKGSPQNGVLYAFTLGMAPWAKESTRRHFIAYLRGIGFHVALFVGLAALTLSPWWTMLPALALTLLAWVTSFGAALAAAGVWMRWTEANLRALSTPDDYAAVSLVTLFLATVTAALLNAAWLPVMYAVSAIMLVYIPLGKIRHCLYFFFSRRFFGLFIGRRAVLHSEATR